MADRFTKLFELPRNQRLIGAPLIIMGAVLLKDNESGALIVQMKFQSLSAEPIRGLKLSLSVYDIAGKKIDSVSYHYLDFKANDGDTFGENKAILISNVIARSFEVEEIEVVYSNGDAYCHKPVTMTLPEEMSIEKALGKSLYVEQYKIDSGCRAVRVEPVVSGGLWLCTCGRWNSSHRCTNCRAMQDKVFAAYDVEVIERNLNLRLEEQERIRAEKIRLDEIKKAKKQEEQRLLREKLARIAKPILVAILIILIGAVVWTKYLSTYDRYGLGGLSVSEQNRVQNTTKFYVKDGWIYGQGFDDFGESQFVRVSADFSKWEFLAKGMASNICIVEDDLYYMLWGDRYGMYRMKTNGEERTLLVKACGSMQIVGDSIYFTDDSGNYDSFHHLYKCDLNGDNVVEVISKPTYYACVFNDAILYQDDQDNMSLHICDLDGQNDRKVNDCLSYFPLYDGDFIYYMSEEEYGDKLTSRIWKVRPDGSDNQLVTSNPVVDAMLMTEEHIYFVNPDDNQRLYRIDKNGANPTMVTQDQNVKYINLFNDYIQYTKYTDDYNYIVNNYFCDYDGSNRRAFEK